MTGNGGKANRDGTPSTLSGLGALVEELHNLKKEVEGVTDNVLDTLEDRWAGFHTVLFPHLTEWCDRFGVTSLAVYSLQTDVLRLENALSRSDKLTELPHQLRLSSETHLLAEALGEDLPRLLKLAVSGRELQLDFSTCQVVVPFCLFDKVVGLWVAELKDISETDTDRLCQGTELLLDKLRREILKGRLSELRTRVDSSVS